MAVATGQPMATTASFRDLEVWQLRMQLVEDIHELTARLPRAEFDLRRQMRRASISIPANIAEGWRRKSRAAYRNHVAIALGSSAELETEIELAIRLKFVPRDTGSTPIAYLVRVGQMLTRLHQSLERG
jgi:four helix bundle protein